MVKLNGQIHWSSLMIKFNGQLSRVEAGEDGIFWQRFKVSAGDYFFKSLNTGQLSIFLKRIFRLGSWDFDFFKGETGKKLESKESFRRFKQLI